MARLFVVLSDGKIPELGNIRGPITKPCSIAISKVIHMVNRGLVVQEVNPGNLNERVTLTYHNVTVSNFAKKPVEMATPVAAPKVDSLVSEPVSYSAPTVPAGRSNVVVDAPNEAKAAKESREKNGKNWKENGKPQQQRVVPVTKSDF